MYLTSRPTCNALVMLIPQVQDALNKLNTGDCFDLKANNAATAKSTLSQNECNGWIDRMLQCPTLTCRGETVNSVQLEPNQTFTLAADSRCTYKVKTPTYITANPNYQVVVSNTAMTNGMSSFPANVTIVSSPLLVLPTHTVMVINTKSAVTQFQTYSEPIAFK